MKFIDTIYIYDTIDDNVVCYVVSGVYFEASRGITVNSDGEKSASSALVIVPSHFISDDSYVTPKIWSKLTSEEKLTRFTFRPEQVITRVQMVDHFQTLNDVLNKTDFAYKVASVETLDKVLPHWEITLK